MLNPQIFRRLPLSSADRTNVARNVGMDGAWRVSYQPSNRAIRAKILVERIEALNAASEWTECRGVLQRPLEGAKSRMAVWDDVSDFDNIGKRPMELTGWLRLLDQSADHRQRALVGERVRENLQMRHNFARVVSGFVGLQRIRSGTDMNPDP